MPVLIESILPGSLADNAGIMSGDTLVSINGMPIRDFLDLEYYASDYQLHVRIKTADGKTRSQTIVRDSMLPLGIEPKTLPQRQCCNKCIFCFIDQMPPGMRPSLYIKDDDYLYSRLYGNYITLTNLSQKDLDRIIDQHISPLFISAHTTDSILRRKMMRHKQDYDLLQTLEYLAENGISYHVQIVCVPGYNDGKALQKSIMDLLSPDLATLSIGIVPVGLTRYRDGLPQLENFTRDRASNLLDCVQDVASKAQSNIVYAADEFYVQACREVPSADYYNGYPQIENGIGMLRLTMDNFSHAKAAFRKTLRGRGGQFLLLSSTAAGSYMDRIALSLSCGRGRMPVRSQVICNHFFGPLISVSGLLTFADIIQQAEPRTNEAVIIPANIFNTDQLTLDGYDPQQLKKALGRDILVVDSFFTDWYWV